MNGRLRMYNVEFGDAFLLYGEGENLLVDLGSADSGFCFDGVRDSIRAECAGGRFSLMLTHFHRDHWFGLHDQTPGHTLPPVGTLYLPDIFGMRFSGELDVIVRSLLGDFLEAVVLRSRPRFTLADLLREVLPGLPEEKIRLLRRGDGFSMGGRQYEVLWPRLERGDVLGRRSVPLEEFLKRTEAKLEADGAEGRLEETLERMADILLRDFAASLEEQVEREPVQGSYEDVYARAQRMAELLAGDVERDIGEYRDKVRRYAQQLSRDWNRVSLVFQERDGADSGGVLMTGDVPGAVLRRLARGGYGAPGLLGEYGVIKAPHHGTSTHFCAILPPCRCLCISNGAGNAGYRKIAEDYEYVYGCRGKGAEMCCTNPRCRFLEATRYCPQFHGYAPADCYDVSW